MFNACDADWCLENIWYPANIFKDVISEDKNKEKDAPKTTKKFSVEVFIPYTVKMTAGSGLLANWFCAS